MNLDTALEIARFALGVLLILANVAVWYGVWLERDSAPPGTQQRGWRILIRGLAAETAIGLFLFAVDTSLGIVQTNEIANAKGAAVTAVKAADIANKAASKLQTALLIAQAAQQGLNEAIKEQRASLDAANQEIAKLTAGQKKVEERQVPRHLTEVQRIALLATLKPFAGQKVFVAIQLGDGEARAYATEFVAVFKAAGWNADGIAEAMFSGTPVIGVQVTLNQADLAANRAPPGAIELIRELVKLGLTKGGFMNEGVATGRIEFRVGGKPIE